MCDEAAHNFRHFASLLWLNGRNLLRNGQSHPNESRNYAHRRLTCFDDPNP